MAARSPIAPRLRALLARLAEEPTAELTDDEGTLLASFGMVEQIGSSWQLTHRVRLRGPRPYVMTPGEYRQDIWPETDSLLDLLETVSPGRLLDMGTGTGIIAVEAAARGHRVVATDLYANTLHLARFNALLNDIDSIDFRQGHLFEPARGETFDLILTVPHYTRVNDQLRLETLRTGLPLVAPGGRLVVATPLEWEGEEIPVVETILRPLVACGASVTVTPIVSEVKKDWFTRAEGGLPGLVSRHRFLITIAPEGKRLEVTRPRDQPTKFFVPLSRLRETRAIAVLDGPDDVGRLEELLRGLAAGLVTLEGLPLGLLDRCRFAAAPCVSPTDARGPAGAILDVAGNVRPCTHGGPIGRVDDSLASLLEKQRALWADTGARRNCDACSARSYCPRCLFPGAMSEERYCALMRASAATLPLLHRLLALSPRLEARRLRVKVHPTAELLAAESRPPPSPDDAAAQAVKARLLSMRCWIAVADERFLLVNRLTDGSDWILEVDRATAAVAELLLDGAGLPPGAQPILEDLGGA